MSQFCGVKLRLETETVTAAVLALPTDTVTFWVGTVPSRTVKLPLPPSTTCTVVSDTFRAAVSSSFTWACTLEEAPL